MDENIEEIRAQIKIAREWALEHFNADKAKDTRLIDTNMEFSPPSAFVEFPSPDTMKVSLSVMGLPSLLWFSYRLAFRSDGSMAWNGKHPIYDTPMPPLEIKVDNIEEE